MAGCDHWPLSKKLGLWANIAYFKVRNDARCIVDVPSYYSRDLRDHGHSSKPPEIHFPYSESGRL